MALNWIPVEKSFPKDLKTVLLFDEKDGPLVGYYFTSKDSFICSADGRRLEKVLYWTAISNPLKNKHGPLI